VKATTIYIQHRAAPGTIISFAARATWKLRWATCFRPSATDKCNRGLWNKNNHVAFVY